MISKSFVLVIFLSFVTAAAFANVNQSSVCSDPTTIVPVSEINQAMDQAYGPEDFSKCHVDDIATTNERQIISAESKIVGAHYYTVLAVEAERVTFKDYSEIDNTTIVITLKKQHSIKSLAAQSETFCNLKKSNTIVTVNQCTNYKTCQIKASQIEFDEIPSTGPLSLPIHWIYQISRDVPPLVGLVSQCATSFIPLSGGEEPYTDCINVDQFRFGKP